MEGGAGLLPAQLVVGDPVAVPVPRLPQPLGVHAGVLDLAQQPVVDRQVVLLAVLQRIVHKVKSFMFIWEHFVDSNDFESWN